MRKAATNLLICTILIIFSLFLISNLMDSSHQQADKESKRKGVLSPESGRSTELSVSQRIGVPTNSSVEQNPNMIAMEEVLKTAFKQANWRDTCDTNTPPSIERLDGDYLVTYWMHENPFRNSPRKYDSKIRIDAQSGEVLDTHLAQGGSQVRILDPKSQGKTDKERAFNLERIKRAGMELSMRVRHGKELSDAPTTLSLTPKSATEIAVNHALSRGRTYDNQREPMSILIDDVYIIVLWREPDNLAENGPTYDSRVFVDASTGTVIGMEITN